MHSLPKATLRAHYKQKRQRLPQTTQEHAAQRIVGELITHPVYLRAKHLAVYHAIPGEVDVSRLIQDAFERGITCYMPAIALDKTLFFLPYTQDSPTQLNAFNIPEPIGALSAAQPIEAIDLMIVPLVAFDLHGTRLGLGGGYYDRTLGHARPHCLLGVAFSVQEHMLLPKDAWDVNVDGVITEQGIQWFKKTCYT
ncbi:MAG: 5-formyltetrahydrofolate cyclo-ligase [Legionella sp. 21-45-4]|nr:MAG: 5-formyltetrahydrofolate cyclo-ligase [Legionella sp. 21-45-4]